MSSKRTVLITGASRGIGKAIARKYQERGYKILAPSRQELELASAESVRSYAAVLKSTPVDVLINNAGENPIAEISSLDPAVWERSLAVNLTAPFLLIQQASVAMIQQGWGRIVNISSCFSLVTRRGRAAYGAAKSGLNALTRTAALEYARHNILVNALCPGFVETDMTRANNTPEQIEALRQSIPLGRLATAEEIAAFVFFLGSQENTYVTGQTLVIDGGFLCQ